MTAGGPSYREAEAWLAEFANVEQHLDPRQWAGVKLERVRRLVAALGHPERSGRVVHIAGSKGKGSVAALIAAVLQASGRRVGLYSSPHLVSPRERIRIDGEPIAEGEVARLVAERLRPVVEEYQRDPVDGPLTFFDLHTALAFLAFAAAAVDWAVLEVGLGGRLDATNVCRPEACAITSLSLEHTTLLGDSLAAVAGEKAGIIKPGVPVVSAPQPPEAWQVLAAAATRVGAPLVAATGVTALPGGALVDDGETLRQRVTVDWPGGGEVALPLVGEHQVLNAAVARTVLEQLAARGHRLDWSDLAAGFSGVRWPGRLQVIGRRPWLVLDGAHTPEAAGWLARTLNQMPHRRRFLVLGSHLDKDFRGLAANLVPGTSGVVVADIPGNPRAATAEQLRPAVSGLGARVEAVSSPAEALELAMSWAGPEDLVVVTGSLYLVGAVLAVRNGGVPA